MTIGLNPLLNKQNTQTSRRFDVARAVPARLTDTERTNIVILRKRAGDNSGLHIAPDGERPAQETSRFRKTLYWSALIGVVLMMHSAVVLAFMGHTKPQASVGLESISVEIVLGAETAAGLASAPSESEAAASEPESEPTPPEPEVTERPPKRRSLWSKRKP